MSGDVDKKAPPVKPFTFQPEHDGSLPIAAAVYQALGRASTCWETMSGTGVFDDAAARGVGEALLGVLREREDATEDLLHRAWGIIANAGMNGDPRSPGWDEAAVRFRDEYHVHLAARCAERPQPAAEPAGAAS
jgi:hypothetical protein